MSERVSVLIATYNYARYLPQCLGRVLNQTRPPDEIVVVDDGSTDGTPELMKQFPEVRYVYQQNAGKPAAFGRALSLSSGEIVCHLDADDYWEPDKLARVLHCLERDPSIRRRRSRGQLCGRLRPRPSFPVGAATPGRISAADAR